MRAGPSLRSCRSRQTWSSIAAAVRRGVVCGRLGRSCSPASPCVRQRRSHLWAVALGDAYLGRDMRDRAAGTDTLDQQPPGVNGQPGLLTVGHEDLRAVQS